MHYFKHYLNIQKKLSKIIFYFCENLQYTVKKIKTLYRMLIFILRYFDNSYNLQ